MSKTANTTRPSAQAMRAALRKAGLPVPTGDPKALIAAFQAIPATPKASTSKPKGKPAPANCGCGCGSPTITSKATFLAGHDARHAGVLGRGLAATPDDADLKAAYARLTAPLQVKVDKIRETATRKAGVKAAREVAKAAYAEALKAALA